MGRHTAPPVRRGSTGPGPAGRWWAGRRAAVAGLLASGVLLVIGGVGLSGVWRGSSAPSSAAATVVPSPADVSSPDPIPAVGTPLPATTSTAAVRPLSLQIPSIGVSTSLEQLGIASDGTLQTPTDPQQAGWFTGSSLPGAPGPVVIAGHVDSRSGPGVFAHLKKIKPGDLITVTLSGGRRVVYRTASVLVYPKAAFPAQAVYGARPDSELRLITCGGAFVQGEYVDDVIVFAALAP